MSNSNIFFSIYEVDGDIKLNNFKSHLNIFITPWSVAHFISGYMIQAFGVNYIYGLIGHTIYEYVNHISYPLKKKWSEGWKGFKCDSVFNSVGDTFVFLLGMMLAKNYKNMYLFYFIVILGLLFFSPYVQNYLTNIRLKYLKSKDDALKVENSIFDLHNNYYKFSICFPLWVITSLVVFIKIKNKK